MSFSRAMACGGIAGLCGGLFSIISGLTTPLLPPLAQATAPWSVYGRAASPASPLPPAGINRQVDVKTTWPDGSPKFAVLTEGNAHSGTFTPVVPQAELTITIAGKPYVGRLDATETLSKWLNGNLVKE